MALKNRLVEHPNRYILRDNDGNEIGPYFLIRDEGTIEEEGTPLNAENITDAIIEKIDEAMEPFDIDNEGNVYVKNIQKGKAKIEGKAKAVAKKEIKFPKAFDKIPTVVVSPITQLPESVHASAYNVTTTGFTLHLYRKTKATNTVHWIAIV